MKIKKQPTRKQKDKDKEKISNESLEKIIYFKKTHKSVIKEFTLINW